MKSVFCTSIVLLLVATPCAFGSVGSSPSAFYFDYANGDVNAWGYLGVIPSGVDSYTAVSSWNCWEDSAPVTLTLIPSPNNPPTNPWIQAGFEADNQIFYPPPGRRTAVGSHRCSIIGGCCSPGRTGQS